MRRERRWLKLEISDDGQGFDPRAGPGAGSAGLAGMRDRAELLGGEMTLESAPDRGTRLTFTLPLPGAEAGAHPDHAARGGDDG